MNFKFDSTQFKVSLSGKASSSLQEYKTKEAKENNVILSTENGKLKVQHECDHQNQY